MPKKLVDCVERVKASGKSESEAWAICIKSTGLKPHKKSELIDRLISLATSLDEAGLTDEATILDTTLEKEAQWQWFKEKGQQLKDWYQGEKQMDRGVRNKLEDLRKNHWNLVKRLNTAYQLLTKSHKNIGKPEYLRDITSLIKNTLQELGKAVQVASAAPAQQQSQQPQPPAAPAAGTPPPAPATPAPPPAPGAAIAPGAALVERLTKLADKLEAKGNKEAAKAVRAQMQSVMEMGQRGMDWMLGRGQSPRAETDKQWSNFHWRVASAFKSAYDKLNAARQYLNDPNAYVQQLQAAATEIQNDLTTILMEIEQAGQPAATPAAPATAPAAAATPATPAPTPEEEAALKKTQLIQPADQLAALVADMTPEQQQKIVEIVKKLRGTPTSPTAPKEEEFGAGL